MCAVSIFGKSLIIKGELRSSEDLTLEGRIDGAITCEGCALVVTTSATVTGDVIARDITVFGKSQGQLIATEIVDVRPEAEVSGKVMSRAFILHDGAKFNGRVEPQHLEAALRVAKFNEKKAQTKEQAAVV